MDIDKLLRTLYERPYTSNGQHGLDPAKVQSYLTSVNPKYHDIIAFLLEHTAYITMETTLAESYKTASPLFQALKENFYIYLPSEKIGSEYWFTAKLYPLFAYHPHFKGYINNDTPLEKGHIIIIDDAIYSGVNVLSMIDEFTDNMVNRIKDPIGTTLESRNRNYKQNIKELAANYVFHLLVPYVLPEGKQEIVNFAGEDFTICFYHTNELTSLRALVRETKLESVYKGFYTAFTMEGHASPTYFDHKVANNFGSFPQIYLEGYNGKQMTGTLLKKLPDRSMIEKLGVSTHKQ